MELNYYTNTAGRRFGLPDGPLEPSDCWAEKEPDPEPACRCAQCGQDIWPGGRAYSDGSKGKRYWCGECFQAILSSEWRLPEIAEQLGYDTVLL